MVTKFETMVGMLFWICKKNRRKKSQLPCVNTHHMEYHRWVVVEVSSFSNENQIHRHQSGCIISCLFVVGSLW